MKVWCVGWCGAGGPGVAYTQELPKYTRGTNRIRGLTDRYTLGWAGPAGWWATGPQLGLKATCHARWPKAIGHLQELEVRERNVPLTSSKINQI